MDKPMTNLLRFEVSPTLGMNDHQARLIVDKEDWLGPEHLGLDPPHLRSELTTAKEGLTIVGRCSCGCADCGDLFVNVQREALLVRWAIVRRNDGQSEPLTFDARQYDAEIERFARDHSWEDDLRRAERHVEGIFAGTTTEHGLQFNWASARIRPKTIILSFVGSNTGNQMEFGWDGVTLESAIAGAEAFYRQQLVDAGAPPVLRHRLKSAHKSCRPCGNPHHAERQGD